MEKGEVLPAMEQEASAPREVMTSASLPQGVLLAFYGDDFTGSTDAMEALAKSGVKTVLFLEPPTPELLAERFPHVECIGVAGISRSLSPKAMEQELIPVFEALHKLKPRMVHYKVCSTFDSSPQTGSIGKAIELGLAVFGERRFVPVLAGVPVLGRYTVFGHHFAYSMGDVYRLDRHPVMSRHPVTPMAEADLRLHLAKQTEKRIGHLSVLDLQSKELTKVQLRLEEELNSGSRVVLFDVLDDAMQVRIGELLWHEAMREESGSGQNLEAPPLFAAGSSGVEYALAGYWKEQGLIAPARPSAAAAGEVGSSGQQPKPLLVLSGSCSPVTEGQIRYALDHGFIGLRAPVLQLADADTSVAEEVENRLMDQAAEALRTGRHVIIYTSLGPQDDTIPLLKQQLADAGIEPSESGKLLGSRLGRMARELIGLCQLRRLLVAGGDTSGYLIQELGIMAMELQAPLVPGGPLCKVYAEDEALNGLELCLKGGQVGPPDFFVRVMEERTIGP